MIDSLLMYLRNVSIQAVIIFGILLFVRALFSLCRVPKKYAYILWIILFIRLLIPIQPESAFGLIPQGSSIIEAINSRRDAFIANAAPYSEVRPHDEKEMKPTENVQETQRAGAVAPGADASQGTDTTMLPEAERSGVTALEVNTAGPENKGDEITVYLAGDLQFRILFAVWLGGLALLALYNAVSYGRLKKKVRCSIRLNSENFFNARSTEDEERWRQTENIYMADEIDTPFVMGVISPKIYLPSIMEEKNLPYVILHEQIHIQRRDYLIKMTAYLITCFYWFHPLVWLGFLIMSRDMEMSCDEAVMEKLGEEKRGGYAESLLLLSCGNGRFTGASPAFSEGDTKGRIKHIVKYKKPITAITVFAVVFVAILAAALLTSPRKNPDKENQNSDMGNTGSSDIIVTSKDYIPDEVTPSDEYELTHSEVKIAETGVGLPEISLNSSLGEKGVILDYADDEIVVFHGNFGLYVYSKTEDRLVRSVTSENDFTSEYEVYVTKYGEEVLLYPLGNDEGDGKGTAKGKIDDYGLVLNVETGELSAFEYPDNNGSGSTVNYMGVGVFDVSQFEITENCYECRTWLGTGAQPELQSYHCAVFEENGTKTYGYLESVDGTIGSLVYVEKKYKSDGTWENKCVRLFGGEPLGSSAAIYDNTTKVTIDGTVYDIAERNSDINAIMGIQYADGFWIVEGHINPNVGSYSLYSTQNDSWETDMFGSCLTWENLENAALGDSIRKTAVYAANSQICNYKGDVIGLVSLEQGEYVRELIREGDMLTVQIQTASDDIRELQFPCIGNINMVK